MKILAVETSTSSASVAVMYNNNLIGEIFLECGKTHSQKLMPLIDEILHNLELAPSDIDIFAASSGPGSFTGLRIGITTIKAMAFVGHKPVIGIPSLDVLAYNAVMAEALVCPIMDARNNQVYTALYKNEEGLQKNITEYSGIPVTELMKIIKGKNTNVVFTGDAVKLHRDFIKKELGSKCTFMPDTHLQPRASSVAQLAMHAAANGVNGNCFDMVPFYLRKPQAEREYEKMHPEQER